MHVHAERLHISQLELQIEVLINGKLRCTYILIDRVITAMIRKL
jgi:hypothetical protein